jgi:ketosteroid isomerase-like protein
MGEADVITPPGCAARVRDYLVRVTDVYATHDIDALRELITDDVVFLDHRPLGADAIVGHEATAEWARSMFELMPNWKIRVEVLAQEGDVYVAHDFYDGAGGDQFGAAALDWYVVDVLRDGKLAREEIFADEHAARAAFARLLAVPAGS